MSPTGGLDGNTQERLRKGMLDPDARIDLHGMTEDVAHNRLLAFLTNAQRGGARLALVITGKGARVAAPDEPFDMEQERRARGVLKSLLRPGLQPSPPPERRATAASRRGPAPASACSHSADSASSPAGTAKTF